jgi:hypothetical protein
MALAARPGATAIRPLFAADPDRFVRFSRQAGDVLLDFSKTAISDAVLNALLALAEASDVAGFRARLFAGAAVNATEGRAALHMALRAEPGSILAFLPGAAEIERTAERLADRLPGDVDHRMLQLAILSLATYPIAFPQITLLVTGRAATGAGFQKDWQECLRWIGRRILAPDALPGKPKRKAAGSARKAGAAAPARADYEAWTPQ